MTELTTDPLYSPQPLYYNITELTNPGERPGSARIKLQQCLLFTQPSASFTSHLYVYDGLDKLRKNKCRKVIIFSVALKSVYLTKWTKQGLYVSFRPRDRETCQTTKVTYPRCLSKQLDGTECMLSPWWSPKLQSEMEDLHLGIIGDSRLAIRAVKSVLVWVCVWERERSSPSRLLSSTQVLVRKHPCNLIRGDWAAKSMGTCIAMFFFLSFVSNKYWLHGYLEAYLRHYPSS